MPEPLPAETPAPPPNLPVAVFRRKLLAWYQKHARDLPWRGTADPYAIWVSEVMLQQTRVATVIDRYREFLERFPTVTALGQTEPYVVLAMWSGLGYYARARNMHRAAQVIAHDLGGIMPHTARELRKLPGVGPYTAAAITSIAFGECVAVMDGNVERVLLRVIGQAEDRSAPALRRLAELAQVLMPLTPMQGNVNPPGDHNQAMMELGATVCLPSSPLCLQCPVVDLCKTRGEHITTARHKMQSRLVAHLLTTRKLGVLTEVLLQMRPQEATQMPGMLELPPLPLEAVEGLESRLRLRHAITTTNYVVDIYTEAARFLQRSIPTAARDLYWIDVTDLPNQPLTGLARKVLKKMNLMNRRP